MRHAPGHFPPGRGALRHLQLRQIFKHNDNAGVLAFFVLNGRQGQQNRQHLVPQRQFQMLFQNPHAGFLHFLQKGIDQGEMILVQKLPVIPEQIRRSVNAEHGFRGAVDGRDGSVPVDGDDARRDIAQNGGHVLSPLLQRRIGLDQAHLAFVQIIRHGIEGLDQQADLVVGFNVNAAGQVPPRDAVGRRYKVLDGVGNALGQRQAEPRREKNNRQRHDGQGHDVIELDRILQELDLSVLFRRVGDAPELVHQPLGNAVADAYPPDDFRRHGIRKNRRDADNGLPALGGGHRGDFLSGVNVFQHLRRQLDGGGRRFFAVGKDDAFVVEIKIRFHARHLVVLLALGKKIVQIIGPIHLVEAVAGDFSADLTGVEFGQVLGLRVIHLCDFQRPRKGVADFDVEPELDRIGKKVDGKQKKQNGGNQGKAHERRNQLGAQLRADQSLATLGKQLENIADNQKKQKQNQDDVDAGQAVHQNVGRNGQFLPVGQLTGQNRKYNRQTADHQHDDALTPAFSQLPFVKIAFSGVSLQTHALAASPFPAPAPAITRRQTGSCTGGFQSPTEKQRTTHIPS